MEVAELLDKVRDEITLGNEEDVSDNQKVFQLNLQLYPLTELIERKVKWKVL